MAYFLDPQAYCITNIHYYQAFLLLTGRNNQNFQTQIPPSSICRGKESSFQ